MRAAIGKYLALAAAGLILPGLASGNPAATINANAAASGSATVNVTAHMSFESVITAGTKSDAAFGGDQPGPNIMPGAAGNRLLEGKNGILSPYGRPGVIIIGDTRGQILNFLPDNYRPGGGISFLHVRCVLKGVDNAACDTSPVSGKRENTLFIGVDMTVEDGITPVDNETIPSFDMSVVYQ